MTGLQADVRPRACGAPWCSSCRSPRCWPPSRRRSSCCIAPARFTAEDVPVVAGVLMWWALGLHVLRRLHVRAEVVLLASGHEAHPCTRTSWRPRSTSVLYAVLARGVAGWDGLGIIGIPIADGIFFCGHLLALSVILRTRIGGLDGQGDRGGPSSRSWPARWRARALHGLLMQLTAGLGGLPAGFLIQLLVAGAGGLVVAYGAWPLLARARTGDVHRAPDEASSAQAGSRRERRSHSYRLTTRPSVSMPPCAATRTVAAIDRIVVIDDASSDGTADLAASAGAEVLRLDEQPRQGRCAAGRARPRGRRRRRACAARR